MKVFWSRLKLKIAIAAHHCVASQLMACCQRHPSRRVELQLQERRARMDADVVGLRGVGAVEDVRVAVRRALVVNSGADCVSHRSMPNQNAMRFWKLYVPPVPSWVGKIGGSSGMTSRYSRLFPDPGVSE